MELPDVAPLAQLLPMGGPGATWWLLSQCAGDGPQPGQLVSMISHTRRDTSISPGQGSPWEETLS